MAQQDGYALGVDLGTSNTVAVLRWPDGRTRPLLFDGQPVMPSGVFLDTNGRFHVGRDAQRLAQADPARYEPNPKRRVDEPGMLLGDREVPTVDLLGALLGAVARAAVEAVGFLPPAVVTYPAAWGARRRGVLAGAIARAGWPPVDPATVQHGEIRRGTGTICVPEPVAAARYFADVLRRPVPVGSAIAVFDFGGGTLDIAVVRNEGADENGRGRFAVIGSGGVAELGGLDLDSALVDHLGQLLATADPQAWQQLSQPTTPAQWRNRRQFWDDVRGAKEMLSRSTVAPVPVPGVDQAVHLTRDELERLATPLLRRGVREAGLVITNCRMSTDQLAGLFLVGGSSRVPLVARLLHSELGIAPTVLEQPELPVAEGALAELVVPPVSPATAADRVGLIGAGGSVGVGGPDRPYGANPAGPPVTSAPPVTSVPAASVGSAPAGLVTQPGTGQPAEMYGSPATGSPATLSVPSAPPYQPGVVSGPPYQSGGTSGVPHQPGPPAGQVYQSGVSPPDRYGAAPVSAVPTSGGQHYGGTSFPPPHPRGYQQPAGPSAHGLAGLAVDPDRPVGGLGLVRRRPVWIGAAAVVALLAVVTAGYFYLTSNRYAAIDFQSFTEVDTVDVGEEKPNYFYTEAVGDRAYAAFEREDERLEIIAVDLTTGKADWRKQTNETSARWAGITALPNGVIAYGSEIGDANPRDMVFFSERGERLWARKIRGNDGVVTFAKSIVIVDRTDNQLIGLDLRSGNQNWTQRTPADQYGYATTTVRTVSTVADISGPASASGTAFAPDRGDDERIVQVGADRSVRVIDVNNGKVLKSQQNIADPGDSVLAYDGNVFIGGKDGGYSVVKYDLETLQPSIVYTSADAQRRLTGLEPCGKGRICLLETANSDRKTTELIAVDADKGGQKWRKSAAGVDQLVPVGDHVIAQNTSDGNVKVFKADGAELVSREGVAVRLDAANMLIFGEQLSTYDDSPTVAGLSIKADEPVELGLLKEVRPASCSWNTAVVICAGTDGFVIRRFARE